MFESPFNKPIPTLASAFGCLEAPGKGFMNPIWIWGLRGSGASLPRGSLPGRYRTDSRFVGGYDCSYWVVSGPTECFCWVVTKVVTVSLPGRSRREPSLWVATKIVTWPLLGRYRPDPLLAGCHEGRH